MLLPAVLPSLISHDLLLLVRLVPLWGVEKDKKEQEEKEKKKKPRYSQQQKEKNESTVTLSFHVDSHILHTSSTVNLLS